jgi:hypothetical protein
MVFDHLWLYIDNLKIFSYFLISKIAKRCIRFLVSVSVFLYPYFESPLPQTWGI